MGAAYAKGFAEALQQYCKDNGIEYPQIEYEIDLAPYEPDDQKAVDGIKTIQVSHDDDLVAGFNRIDGAKYFRTAGGHKVTDFSPDIANYIPESVHNTENQS